MRSILDGTYQIIDQFIGVTHIGKRAPHYGNKAACLTLSDNPPNGLNGFELVERTFRRIEANWDNSPRSGKPPSKENWRHKPSTEKVGQRLEVRLERAIVELEGMPWANQVPTSSGLMGAHLDKTRNIDLVYDCGNGRYKFVELKVNSNTPLFAAMEILGYGLIYLFSRLYRNPSDKKMLDAKSIHLKVLAPYKYYYYITKTPVRHDEKYQLAWLEGLINDGLGTFLDGFGVSMDFRFEAFPPDSPCRPADIFPDIDKTKLRAALQNIQPVYPR